MLRALRIILVATLVVNCFDQAVGQFEGLQNFWNKAKSNLPPIRVGNFDLIPARPQDDVDTDQFPESKFEYDDIIEDVQQTVSTPSPIRLISTPRSQQEHGGWEGLDQQVRQTGAPLLNEQIRHTPPPVDEQIRQTPAPIEKQIQLTTTAPLQKLVSTAAPYHGHHRHHHYRQQYHAHHDNSNSLNLVIEKLTSIESKIDNLQQELKVAKETIELQSKQLQNCKCGSCDPSPVPEVDLSDFARSATTSKTKVVDESVEEWTTATAPPIRIVDQREKQRQPQPTQQPTHLPYPEFQKLRSTTNRVVQLPVPTQPPPNQWYQDFQIVQSHRPGHPHYAELAQGLQDLSRPSHDHNHQDHHDEGFQIHKQSSEESQERQRFVKG